MVIAYGSMYGNTAQMAEKIARELTVQGVKNIIVHNLSYADISNVIRDIFKYDTLISGFSDLQRRTLPRVGSLLQKSANDAFLPEIRLLRVFHMGRERQCA